MIRLEQLRYDAGLTAEQLAEQVGGVSARTIRRIESGAVAKPRPAIAKRIAAYFGEHVTATDLLQPVEREAA